jgi:hypothetical protein
MLGEPFKSPMSHPYIRSRLRRVLPALQRTNTENSKQIFQEKDLRCHSSNFHIHVSVSNLYIPTIDMPILLHGTFGLILKNIKRTKTHECGSWD